ncbi:MAG TPA: PAS domain S-box protein [Chitinophagaceae bacterium]
MALFSIKRTIVAGFVVALAIICFFAGYTYLNMRSSQQSSLRVESILKSLRLTESIYDNIQEIETGQRGYIISGDKQFLQPYYSGLRELESDTLALKELNVHEDGDRQEDIGKLLELVQRKITFAQTTIDLRDKKGFAAVEAEVRLGLGRQLKDSLHAVIKHIEGEDRLFLNFYNDHRARMARQTTFLFILLAGLFILFLVFFFWWIRRDIKRRLNAQLSEQVKENTIVFKDILERISDGFLALDKNWNFVYLNKAIQETSQRSDLTGKNIWKEFPDGVGNEFYKAYHRAMETQEYVYLEAYYPGFDAWFENHIYPSPYGLSIHSRNITEKKRTESKLQHAVDRFNMVANATSDILWEADLEKGTTWWNDNFYEKFGYDKKDDFSAPDTWERLLHPDDKKRVTDNINFVLYNTSDISWIDEYQFRKADGSYAEIYDRCYIMRDEAGKAYKIIGSMTDISMLMQMREKLRATEDRYRIMVEEASDAIFINDGQGKFFEANKRACEIFGYTEHELRNMNVADLMPPEELAAKPIMFKELLSGERTSLERKMLRKDGTRVPVDITARMLSDGRIIAIVRDITERRKAEELIRKNEEQLELIYNASGDVIFLVSIEEGRCYRFKSVNQTFFRITGLTPSQIIGKCIEDVIPPGSLSLVKSKYEEAITTGKTVQWEEISEYPTGKKTGIVTVNPVFNDKGECILLVGGVHDITERKIIEEQVRRSREEFASLVNSIDGIVWEADAQTFRFSFVSEQAERLLGYPVQDWVDEPTFWVDHIHPDDREWAIDYCRNCTSDGRSHEFEYRMISANKSIVWLRDIISVVTDGDNKPARLRGIMIDITEKKRIDEIIRDSDEKRRLIMNAALDAIVSIDDHGRIIFWNPQAERIFGWEEGMVKGKMLSDTIIPEKYKEAHKKGMARYLTTGEGPVINRLLELSAINNEGKEFPIELSIIPVVQEGATTFTAFIRDITARKMAAEELRLSVERFETIATATHDAIWEWNLESEDLWANEVHQQMYGLKKSDPVPTVDEWKQRIHPDDREKTLSAQDMALNSDINYWESEYRFLKSGGQYITIYDRCYIVRDRQNKPVRLTGSMIDISRRKKIEEELKRSEEQYRSVIEQASDFIMVTDSKGNFLDGNSNLYKTFGYTKEEFTQMNVAQLLDPEQLKVKPVRFDLLAQGETLLNERRMMDRNGKIVEVEANVKMLPDGRLLAIARDVRERKKAEAEIIKARDMADKMIDALPGVFYLFDENGKFIRWNKQLEIVTGYTADEIANIHPTQFFDDDEKEYIARQIMGVFEKGMNDAEASFLTKTGGKIPYYFKAVLLNYEGKPCLLGSGIDISERKKAEEELKQSEQKYKLLFDTNPLPMWMTTIPDLGIIEANEAAVKRYGYSKEEFSKLNARDMRPLEDVENFEKEVEKMRPGITNTRRWRHRKKDGSIIHVEIFSHEVLYEGKKVWLGLSNDITIKVLAEEALKASEKKYKLLFENNPMPMMMLSLPDLSIIDVNEAAIRHYGYTKEEFLQLNTRDIRPVEDIPRYLETSKNQQEGVKYAGIWKHRKKDGTLIDVEIIAHNMDYGDHPAQLVLANDVTEKLRAEALLKKSFDDVRQLTEHIQKIREEERAHIAREIHDELGQQLTVLKMDVSWLNKRIQSDEPVKEKLKELTSMLDGTVKTVRRISSELRPSLLDDLGLIAAIDWHLKEFEKRTGILTEFEEPSTGLLLPDHVTTGLFRIIQESLTNVARHAEADKVMVELQKTNGKLNLSIQDDGQGFDKEKAANKRTLGILGMKERTEMMGGSYEISSEPGKGTRVVVSIPLSGH